ncbi:hypothetical protein MMC12_003159 [Toensbergia leucococca]|nr:hypothetical protein [Toensbergia leucococca]
MPRLPVSVPTTAPLPSSLRLPTTLPSISKTLLKLSRHSLLSLILVWLCAENQTTCSPCLLGDELDDEDNIYHPAQSLDELREVYEELQKAKGGKRDVVDRVLEGDWRRGISLQQLAMAETQYLLDHPTSHRWTALKLLRITAPDATDSGYDTSSASDPLPRLHMPTFLQKLQREIGPLAKAHYHLTRVPNLPLSILRIQVYETPYSNPRALIPSKTTYVAFPDHTPAIYLSLASAAKPSTRTNTHSLRQTIIDALPKALSRPRHHYALTPTSLSARSLPALLELRGPGRSNAAIGGWSIYAEGTAEASPLASTPITRTTKSIAPKPHQLPTALPTKRKLQTPTSPASKRRALFAAARFGTSALLADDKGIERLDIRFEEPFPGGDDDTEAEWRPDVRVSFRGDDVFGGVRELVEAGAVDGERMGGWMTGEEGVSVGVVRGGRLVGEGKG